MKGQRDRQRHSEINVFILKKKKKKISADVRKFNKKKQRILIYSYMHASVRNSRNKRNGNEMRRQRMIVQLSQV